MGYAPIDSYGMIGNMRTAALVGRDGSIDWLCLPHFDSPSVFAAILDDQKGGRFRIEAHGEDLLSRQFYWPDTNVLTMRYLAKDGVGEMMDFMPVRLARHDHVRVDVVRLVRAVHGRMRFRLYCKPALDYARQGHEIEHLEHGVVFRGGKHALRLTSTEPLRDDGDAVVSEFALEEGESAAFTLQHVNQSDQQPPVSVNEARELLDDTVDYWHQWIDECSYTGRWREAVKRSALALKLMTFKPTGAIVAAPTTSLPEHIGGTRNWDYRFTWIRDAAFTIYALLRIGFRNEAAAFMDWLVARSHELEPDRMLRPVYGIDGRHELPEECLDHLEGYKGSKPVRIGNEAYEQLQMDIMGPLIDAAYVFDRDGIPISHDLWVELRKLTNWVCKNWKRSDHGIWEIRGAKHDFVYTRLTCWLALDRAIRLASARSFPGEVRLWRKNRDCIYQEIMDRGWSEKRRAFVQRYGDEALDAANLIMPLVQFIAPNDPRMMQTIEAIDRPMWKGGLTSDFLVHRYDPEVVNDGVGGPEGGFNICTFWMVEALSRAGRVDRGCLERARLLFDRSLRHCSDLGLFSEQIGREGDALGNFPQGLTHLSLIIAADHLDRALG